MTTYEAAEYLRVLKKDGSPCLERIRNLVNQGRLPYYKPFGRLLFKKSELEMIVKKSKQEAWRWR